MNTAWMHPGAWIAQRDARPDARGRQRRQRWLGAALALVTGASLSLTSAAAQAAPTKFHRGLGASAPTARLSAAATLARGGLHARAVLPDSVDLTANAITPGDQGSVGSCVAWSTGHSILGWYANSTGHGGAPFAPMYLYSQIHASASADGGGASTSSAYNILQDQGIASAATYSQDAFTWRVSPTTADRADAAANKTIKHTYLWSGPDQGTAGRTALKTVLASNTPVELLIPVYNAFYDLYPEDSTMTQDRTTGTMLGYHAIAALGYNATGVVIENSWGTRWGASGFGTLAWDFVDKSVVEASTITGFATNSPPAPPTPTPPSIVLAGADTQPAAGNPKVALSGSDFGATAAAYRLNKFTAKLGSRATAMSWVSNKAATFALPSGKLGAKATVTIYRAGRAVADVSVTYGLSISSRSWQLDPVTGASTGKLTGIGMLGSSQWALQAANGSGTLNLPVLNARVNLDGVSAGVFVASDTSATVKLPARVEGRAGGWSLSFTPNNATHPGLKFAPSDAANVSYLTPALSRLAPAAVGSEGGATVTVTGSNLASLSLDDPAAVTLRSTTGATATALLTSVTPTRAVFTAPALALGPWRVVLASPLGESQETRTADKILSVTSYSFTASDSRAAAGGGTKLTLTSSGLGTSAKQFAANAITASVGAKTASLTWGRDNSVVVTMPSGTLGKGASLALLHRGAPGPSMRVTYVATISAATLARVSTSGGVVTYTGTGFAGRSTWTRQGPAGVSGDLNLPVRDKSGFAAASVGVLIVSATQAKVKLPAAAAGIYSVGFSPDQSLFPGAVSMSTSSAVVTYADRR